jgi:hypothetical protein
MLTISTIKTMLEVKPLHAINSVFNTSTPFGSP